MILKDRKEYNKYAPVPFWSWNNKMEEEEIQKQIRQMYEAGYGGFIIHARIGLTTPYMSEAWLSCVQCAVEEAKALDMRVWLYDEFGFPSGLAGGVNLQDEEKRAQYLECVEEACFNEEAFAVFVEDEDGFKRVNADTGAGKYYSVLLKTSETEVDVCNPAVAQGLLDSTHEVYYARFAKYFGDTIEGYFTDEPQYYRYATPYSKRLNKEFTDDIRDGLIWLFKEGEAGYAFRVQYYKTLNRLYTFNYYKPIYDWCEAHGCKLTGHTVEEPHLFTQMWCCAGAMPSYEFEQVPGVDFLCKHTDGIIDFKQIGSAAAQFGRKQVLTETFGCAGLEVEPKRLRYLADRQYACGVNYMVQHLMNYSVQGQGITDNPPDFSPHTPWWRDIGIFNGYFARLGYIVANTVEEVQTLVIHPMQSAYLTYRFDEDEKSVEAFDKAFTELTDRLAYKSVPYHYGDESIMARHAKIEGDTLVVGKCAYKHVIIPYTESISKITYDLLRAFAEKGGRVYLYKDFPKYIDGVRKTDETAFGTPLNDSALPTTLTYLRGDSVLSRRCKGDMGEFMFLVNCDENARAEVSFEDVSAFAEYDLVSGKTYKLGQSVTLAPCGSVLLKRCKGEYIRPTLDKTNDITTAFAVVGRTKNSLMLDFVTYSKDGVNFSKSTFYSKMLEDLILEEYKGPLFVRYTFRSEIDVALSLVSGNTRVTRVTVDGCDVKGKQSDYDCMYTEYDLGRIVAGEHTVLFEIDYAQSDDLHHILFDESVTDSMLNCLVYETTVEPIYLQGEFAVYQEGIISPMKEIFGLDHLQDKGLKFFAGEVALRGKVMLEDTTCAIALQGRYMTARVVVNGALVGTFVLDDRALDISEYTRVGENNIEISITSSLRNTYGPHHVRGLGDKYGIIPRMFTFRGCWEGENAVLFGQSYFAPDYEYVPFGVEKVTLYTK